MDEKKRKTESKKNAVNKQKNVKQYVKTSLITAQLQQHFMLLLFTTGKKAAGERSVLRGKN